MLVLSENVSRLSPPSTARVPLTLTGTSSATGCALLTSSAAADVSVERSGLSGEAGSVELSLNVGGMSGSLATESFG